jgi:hypothetical protein
MLTQSEFQKKLDREFDKQIRIRWSNRNNEWLIEQKVNNANQLGYRFDDTWDDDSTRLRDGYALICSITPGDRKRCPACGITLDIPVFRFKEVKCDYCSLKGRDARFIAGHFPLGDMLLDHLRKLDPARGWRDSLVKAIDIKNAKREEQTERDLENVTQGVIGDNYGYMTGRPQVGYTGKELK